ncbi:hypothetical protein BGZ80_007891 [Entomortierella chlamydospora]|uniref:Arm-like repeat domain-containing protein n=1 Tax=Entomortierella chlamydospora TaxID=101097 RepID=A0A9P6MYU6_9FUNG|nr:hypothetical protein BGZ80_007891 [Entomortierella chlamydospora]
MDNSQSRGGSIQQTGTSRPGGKSGDPQPPHLTVDYLISPTTVDAMDHSITLPPNQTIFAQSAPLTATRYALPESGKCLITVPQFAYCLSLIQPSLVPNDGLDEIEHRWSQHILDDKDEQERLKAMPVTLIKAFIQEAKDRYTVTEIVSMAAILEQDDFRKLFRIFDDLTNPMVDSQVKGLSYDQFSTPLEEYLCELQKSADAYLIYQVAYASQALMHITDNESVLRTAPQRAGKVVRRISGVVSAVKTPSIIDIVDGLNNIQFGPTGLENMAKPTNPRMSAR